MYDVLSSKMGQTFRNIANDLLDDMNRQILPMIRVPLPQILNRRSKKPEQQTKVPSPLLIFFLERIKQLGYTALSGFHSLEDEITFVFGVRVGGCGGGQDFQSSVLIVLVDDKPGG